MASFAQVERFIDFSKQAASPRDLDHLLNDITGEMGFDHYALVHHVDLSLMRSDFAHMTTGAFVALTNYPPGWVEAYVDRNIVANDPIHLASHRTNVGFRWAEVGRLVQVTCAHRELRDDALRAGIEDGFTVPTNVPGEAKGSCSFAMRVGRPLPTRNLLMAQMIAVFAFEAARAMVLNARRDKPMSHRPLTPRQIECVTLMARGKTDWEIARILGVHEQTVTEHLNAARERYGVSRRAQLVAQSLYSGELSFEAIFYGVGH